MEVEAGSRFLAEITCPLSAEGSYQGRLTCPVSCFVPGKRAGASAPGSRVRFTEMMRGNWRVAMMQRPSLVDSLIGPLVCRFPVRRLPAPLGGVRRPSEVSTIANVSRSGG